MISDLVDANVGLLEDFASNGILETLARLRESCDRRIATFGPVGLPAEQAAVVMRDQYDDRGIDARKYLAAAIRIHAHTRIAPGTRSRG